MLTTKSRPLLTSFLISQFSPPRHQWTHFLLTVPLRIALAAMKVGHEIAFLV